MTQKRWSIDRRTMLRGAGASIALPFLDSMAWGRDAQAGATAAKNRFCTFFIPFGVTGVPKGHRHEMWNWLPEERADGSYHFREVMKSLNPLKDRVTIVQGLHHLGEPGGHGSGDGFLTGTGVGGTGSKNTVSVDQVYASKVGEQTRFSSLVLGLDGGIGDHSNCAALRSGGLQYHGRLWHLCHYPSCGTSAVAGNYAAKTVFACRVHGNFR